MQRVLKIIAAVKVGKPARATVNTNQTLSNRLGVGGALPAASRSSARDRWISQSFTWGICNKRAGKLERARSRLYRSQILQENMRWKALAEIYTMHSFAPFWNRIPETRKTVVLVGSVWVKQYTKINIEKRKSGKS